MAEKAPKLRQVHVTRDSHLLFADGKAVPDLKGRYDLKEKRVYVRFPGEVEREYDPVQIPGIACTLTSLDGKVEYYVTYDCRTASEFIAAVNAKKSPAHATEVAKDDDEKKLTAPKKQVTGGKRKAEQPRSSRLYILTKKQNGKSEIVGVFDDYHDAVRVMDIIDGTMHRDENEKEDEQIEFNIDLRFTPNVVHASRQHKCRESSCQKDACIASRVAAPVNLFALCTDHYEERLALQIKRDFDAHEAQSDEEDGVAAEPSPKRTKV